MPAGARTEVSAGEETIPASSTRSPPRIRVAWRNSGPMAGQVRAGQAGLMKPSSSTLPRRLDSDTVFPYWLVRVNPGAG